MKIFLDHKDIRKKISFFIKRKIFTGCADMRLLNINNKVLKQTKTFFKGIVDICF